jgi:outer membrane biosynthesis protein TonB
LAKSLAISLAVHVFFLATWNFPRIADSEKRGRAHSFLRGELRAGSASVAPWPSVGSTDQASPTRQLEPGKTARIPQRERASGKQSPVQTSSAEPLVMLDAASLSAYRLALARQAKQLKRHSPTALDAGMEVEVLVGMRNVPGLPMPKVSLLRSCGNHELDEAALRMITEAVLLAPLPAEWRGRHWQIELPVLFMSGV